MEEMVEVSNMACVLYPSAPHLPHWLRPPGLTSQPPLWMPSLLPWLLGLALFLVWGGTLIPFKALERNVDAPGRQQLQPLSGAWLFFYRLGSRAPGLSRARKQRSEWGREASLGFCGVYSPTRARL